MIFTKTEVFFAIGIYTFLVLQVYQGVQSLPVAAGDIGPAVYHAAIIGNYAGQLSGGQALSKLKFIAKPEKSQKEQEEDVKKDEEVEEEHDFSEAAAKDSPSLYESVGTMGDHLNEEHFPTDYESEDNKEDNKETKVEEYAEPESQSAASENYQDFEENNQEAYKNEVDFGAPISDDDEFYSKPVPGIDHGKGAYSYSSTYEFPKY